MLTLVLRIQAAYYVLTGLWPIVDLDSFEMVTGPKVDDWLVRMVGLLAASIGAVLWIGARPLRPAGAIIVLATLSALSFTIIDVNYVLAGRISPIYLGDAIAEAMFLAGLALGRRRAMA